MATLSRHWSPYLGTLFLPLLVLGLWSEWRDFFSLWHDSIIYAHGYLVLAGVLFLLFQRREALKRLSISGSPLALFFLAGASVALLLAQAADIRVVRLLLTPVLILLWGWSIWGRSFLRVAAGPVSLLLFAVPVWDDFSPLLQHITVFFNTLFLQLADIEATINEFLIVLEVGAFLVEDGCSGVRYLMVALFLGAFYGQLYYQSLPPKLLLMLAAALLSMLANWIRVFGVIAAGHYTNMETSLVRNHELFGWVVFIIFTLIPLFFMSSKLEASWSAPAAARLPDDDLPAHPPTERFPWVWPVSATLLVIWPAIVPLALQAKTEAVAEAWKPDLVRAVPEWRGPLPHASIWQPAFSNPDVNLSGVYVSNDFQQVQLQITGYRQQSQDKELIFYRNRLFDDSEWQLVSSSQRQVTDAPGTLPPEVVETVIQARQDDAPIIIWSWYDVGGYRTASKLEAKLAGAVKKISGDGRGALWALAGRCTGTSDPRCEAQRLAFKRFVSQALP